MAEDKKPSRPNLTAKAQGAAEEKRRRLARALRQNLGKRKQQARARGLRRASPKDRD